MNFGCCRYLLVVYVEKSTVSFYIKNTTYLIFERLSQFVLKNKIYFVYVTTAHAHFKNTPLLLRTNHTRFASSVFAWKYSDVNGQYATPPGFTVSICMQIRRGVCNSYMQRIRCKNNLSLESGPGSPGYGHKSGAGENTCCRGQSHRSHPRSPGDSQRRAGNHFYSMPNGQAVWIIRASAPGNFAVTTDNAMISFRFKLK